MMEHHKVFEIKKIFYLFLYEFDVFFFFYFIKVSKLYSSFFVFYSFTWFGNVINIEYNLGIDSLSLIFIYLTLFLVPICLIISWKSIYYNTKYFFLLFLILEILLINVFLCYRFNVVLYCF